MYGYILGVIFLVMIIVIIRDIERIAQLKKYKKIRVLMGEYDMLQIMGKGYKKSSLKNNRCKYEWRINASGSGSSYRGVKKVDIYVKNGLVEEIRPYNI